jgi:hypothetical protein
VWYDRDYLDSLQALANSGYLKEFSPGDTVARGFADIGYEEFLVLPNSALCSKLTGEVSPLNDSNEKFFFLVPCLAQLADVACRSGLAEIRLETELGSRWEASLCEGDDAEVRIKSASSAKIPEQALVTLMLQLLPLISKITAV